MRRTDRRALAGTVLDLMRAHPNEPMALSAWLTELNLDLPQQYHFRSAKQLAQFFRYLSCVVLPATPPISVLPAYRLYRKKFELADGIERRSQTYYVLCPDTRNPAWTPPALRA